MAKEFLKQYEILLKKAIADLNSAKVLLVSFKDGEVELDLGIVFFHLQQCAEKLIKTMLDFNKIKFPHTHDIEELIQILDEQNIEIIENIAILYDLTGYAVEGRYAILHDDLEDADRYINTLDKLLEFVKNTIKQKQ